MPDHYSVWIEVEHYDEKRDHYETLDLPFGSTRQFATLEDAAAYAEELNNGAP